MAEIRGNFPPSRLVFLDFFSFKRFVSHVKSLKEVDDIQYRRKCVEEEPVGRICSVLLPDPARQLSRGLCRHKVCDSMGVLNLLSTGRRLKISRGGTYRCKDSNPGLTAHELSVGKRTEYGSPSQRHPRPPLSSRIPGTKRSRLSWPGILARSWKNSRLAQTATFGPLSG